MRTGSLLYGTVLFAATILAVGLPLMVVSLTLALEIASAVGADLRGSVLGSVVGGAIVLGSVAAASEAIDVYLARQAA